jgi:succinate dehydrogenase / fumarate reductase cytochrome b subunit
MVTVAERPAVRTRRRVASVQLKLVMAASGAVMFLFLVMHMIGNLKVFLGAAAIDHYSAWLRTVGEPAVPAQTVLWLTRVALVAAVLGHMASAIVLTRRAHQGRQRYAHRRPVHGSYAARTMRWGGVIIALFIVYHVLDLTTGTLNPHGGHGEVHANLVADFAPGRWYVTLFYVLAVVAVGVHVRHGLWSALQTVGRSHAGTQQALKTTAAAVAVALTAGFLSVPLSVMTGLVR